MPASIVYEDDLTMAFVDLRQFHHGHTLVIPREHLPNEGLSLWHSIGEAAFQEVPHLHFHIHPRFKGDQLLEVYPRSPATADQQTRDSYAQLIRRHL